jgi:putative FmdB family regulatory protein
MPIYEYRCAACGHHLEALQKMTEGPLRKCPDCGKSQLKRLVSASRFRLKGSGWYETDFKNKGETQRNLVEKAGGDSTQSATVSEPAKDAPSKEDATKTVTAEKGDGAAAKSTKPKDASAKSPAPKRSKSAAKTRTPAKPARR